MLHNALSYLRYRGSNNRKFINHRNAGGRDRVANHSFRRAPRQRNTTVGFQEFFRGIITYHTALFPISVTAIFSIAAILLTGTMLIGHSWWVVVGAKGWWERKQSGLQNVQAGQ